MIPFASANFGWNLPRNICVGYISEDWTTTDRDYIRFSRTNLQRDCSTAVPKRTLFFTFFHNCGDLRYWVISKKWTRTGKMWKYWNSIENGNIVYHENYLYVSSTTKRRVLHDVGDFKSRLGRLYELVLVAVSQPWFNHRVQKFMNDFFHELCSLCRFPLDNFSWFEYSAYYLDHKHVLLTAINTMQIYIDYKTCYKCRILARYAKHVL